MFWNAALPLCFWCDPLQPNTTSWYSYRRSQGISLTFFVRRVLLLHEFFVQVTLTPRPWLWVKHNHIERPYSFLSAINIRHTVQTHLTLPLCHCCGPRRTPRSNQTKMIWLFCGRSRWRRRSVLIHPCTHTHRYTHHYSMAPPYEPISVTDLRLALLCHQLCHIARLLWQPWHDVKSSEGGNK